MTTLTEKQQAKLLEKVKDLLPTQRGGDILLASGEFVSPSDPSYSTALMVAVACVQGNRTLTWLDPDEDPSEDGDDETDTSGFSF